MEEDGLELGGHIARIVRRHSVRRMIELLNIYDEYLLDIHIEYHVKILM